MTIEQQKIELAQFILATENQEVLHRMLDFAKSLVGKGSGKSEAPGATLSVKESNGTDDETEAVNWKLPYPLPDNIRKGAPRVFLGGQLPSFSLDDVLPPTSEEPFNYEKFRSEVSQLTWDTTIEEDLEELRK